MMTAIEPDVKPLGRYTATETSKMLGIHRNTLRNYTLTGDITPLPKKDGAKETRFLGRDITRLWKRKTKYQH